MAKANGLVVSDLHIFSYVSVWDRHAAAFEEQCKGVDTVVLNGDTFEFKRSRLGSRGETISAAVEWLEALLARHPAVRFEYVLGNHDCLPELVDEIRALSQRREQLKITEHILVLGKNLFIHGDVCDSGPDMLALDTLRDRYNHSPRSLGSILFAELVTRTRLNAVEYLRRNPAHLATTLSEHLSTVMPGFEKLVDQVYFGHTHVPFDSFSHGGLSYSNTGCAIRGLRFMPLKFEYANHST